MSEQAEVVPPHVADPREAGDLLVAAALRGSFRWRGKHEEKEGERNE
jgi:hypothetical protein